MKRLMVCIIVIAVYIGTSVHAFASDKNVFTVSHAFFRPFVWSENGVSKGIYVDVLKESIEKRMGVKVQFKDYPWKRAQNIVKKGEADAFITSPTPERLKYTEVVNTPVAISKMGIVTYTNHPRFDSMKKIQKISDLEGYKILTYPGNGWARKNLAEQNVEYGGNSLKEVLNKLIVMRGDITIDSKEVTSFNIT